MGTFEVNVCRKAASNWNPAGGAEAEALSGTCATRDSVASRDRALRARGPPLRHNVIAEVPYLGLSTTILARLGIQSSQSAPSEARSDQWGRLPGDL